jgi:hypothetical protein
MGTNYTRVPKSVEINARKEKLAMRLQETDMCEAALIERGYTYIDSPDDEWNQLSPWDEFLDGTAVHLGKRSRGWKFCWNFHDNKYYSNKAELIKFVLAGRVVDEYGEEVDSQEFLDMAFSWEEPDGLVADKAYFDKKEHHTWMSDPSQYYDRDIDGLRVSSSTEFS